MSHGRALVTIKITMTVTIINIII